MTDLSPDRFAFDCPKCAAKLKAKVSQVGRELNCPGCKSSIKVPNDAKQRTQAPDRQKQFVAPTAKQIEFATELGVQIPEDVDRRALSKMIDGALMKTEMRRYDLLNANDQKENQIRDELRNEVLAEVDEEDPRVSIASVERMIQSLDERQIGAIVILYDYGEMSGDADFSGKTFEMKSTDDLDEDDIKRIISMLGFSYIRRGTGGGD